MVCLICARHRLSPRNQPCSTRWPWCLRHGFLEPSGPFPSSFANGAVLNVRTEGEIVGGILQQHLPIFFRAVSLASDPPWEIFPLCRSLGSLNSLPYDISLIISRGPDLTFTGWVPDLRPMSPLVVVLSLFSYFCARDSKIRSLLGAPRSAFFFSRSTCFPPLSEKVVFLTMLRFLDTRKGIFPDRTLFFSKRFPRTYFFLFFHLDLPLILSPH